ncbi:hypothetical protein HIM_11730 [Hirsutella minnesotensis 3608]|uniref:Uncharacterized protein n=1 Tax=Hirsutella minnesotensis 3608 TaxID=1043627 RepID=A0A0F7ZFB9_9HYPO|nr:hypothetical protein HIM_11730 [Hirsutella minnesotensis 3608]
MPKYVGTGVGSGLGASHGTDLRSTTRATPHLYLELASSHHLKVVRSLHQPESEALRREVFCVSSSS